MAALNCNTAPFPVKEILSGELHGYEIPNIPPKVVRVFLSSAGKDTVTERNTLVKDVYPELREYCRQKYGIEFQIVDIDWGIPMDQVLPDHSLIDFKHREIRRCQRYTAGPTFVALIGQRYGSKFLQTTIPAEEYDLIRMVLHKHKGRETRTAPILDKWYIKDNNSIAPVYVLQDVASVIPDILSENEENRTTALQQWKEAESEMKRLMDKGAEFCYLEGLIDADTKHKYTMSDLESQTQIGIEESTCPSNIAIVLLRKIVDLSNYIDDPKASTFTEIILNDKTEEYEIDSVSTHLLNKMSNRLKNMVTEKNTASFDVLWRYDDVISPELHKEYLKSMSSHFKDKLIALIDQDAPKYVIDVSPEICEEAFAHLIRCRDLAEDFCVRSEELDFLKNYLLGPYSHPIVIHGPLGSGKSTLISKLGAEIPELFHSKVINIVRYVGYTSRSSDVKQLLTSLCFQITEALGRNCHDLPNDFKDLHKFFLNLLRDIPTDIHLILLVDGLENISKSYNAHQLSWLPVNLENNVKVVITTDSTSNQFLNKLQRDVIKDQASYVGLETLDIPSCLLTLDFFLFRYGRKISDCQKVTFQQAFTKHSCPLYVSLCAEKARYLRSTDNCTVDLLPATTREAIHLFFDSLEKEHGIVLVSRAMSYMVASLTGLGDLEMEDLLSLDDDVLNSVYTSYHPPTRRIPYIKWLRLKESLNRFLLERITNGITFYYWRHEMFEEVILERYMKDPNLVKSIHSMLADYFLGTWAKKPKPISTSAETEMLVKSSCASGERYVPTQPLTFQLGDSPVKFNRRMYDQLPRHLYKAERFDELNKLVLFSYEWIYNKTKALSLQHIFSDFALNPGVEATLVEEALRVAESTIESDINNMAPEISGHLLPYYKTLPNIRALVQQCDTAGLKHCSLVPNFSYLQVPGSSLHFTFTTEMSCDFFRFLQDEKYLLTKHRDSPNINVFEMATGETKKTIFTSNGGLYVTPNGAKFLIVDHVTQKAIKVHKSGTGEYIGQLIVLNNIDLKPKEKYKISDISLTNDRLCVIVTTDVSYLCIADIDTCQFLQIICLDGRSDICRITNDGQYVFCNSNEFLLSYDLYSLEHVYTLAIAYRPVSMAFTKDGCRAYICNDSETKLTIIHLHKGTVEMVYKTVLDEDMPNDRLQCLRISPSDDMVLVRGLNNIIVYGRSNEKVMARFPRPKDVPKEFKLPKRMNYVELYYKQAEFSRDGKFVIGTMFRNIYLWQISTGNLITTIQAPVGIISRLLVCERSSHVVTQLDGSTEIQVWNIGDAVNQVDMLDKLSGPIVDVKVTSDNSIAYVVCKTSDEIGVIDMRSGVMLDLLTHDSNVKDFAITPSGNYVLVSTSTKKKDVSNKLWDMSERRIVKEFGNSAGFCISPNTESYILFVSQESTKFHAPYTVMMFRFIGDAFHEYVHPLALKFVLEKPFLTCDDKYLVVLTAQDHIQAKNTYDTPTICTFAMEEDMKVSYFTPESFEGSVNIGSILKIMPCKNNPYTIAVMYESSDDINCNYYSGTERGFLVLDICSGSLISVCYPFIQNEPRIDSGVLFADDYSFCLDSQSNIFDIVQQQYMGVLTDLTVAPSLMALNGTQVVYYDENMLYVVRVRDGKCIAACNVHSKICKLKLCPNERTLICGCEDGTIASYVIIDPDADDVKDVINHLGSRQINESTEMDGRMSRSWDKISTGSAPSRPPSAVSNGPKDKLLLNKVEPAPVFRPSSDTLLYLNPNSKTCSIM